MQVVCQGSGASLWWPNKDHLSDEPDSVRISVTLPHGLKNISNGRLRKVTELPGSLTKFEWYVSYPINNYNLTLNIGKYDHLQDQYVTNDTLTLDYYFMPYNLEKAKVIFKEVKPMLAILEKEYGKFLGIQPDFRYQTITSGDLINYINTKTNWDYSYFFDQYLRHTSLPTLMLKLTEEDNSLIVHFKWKADVENFNMPLHVTTAVGQFGRIIPTPQWQTLTLPDMSWDDFEVDQKRYYVEVEIEE